MAAIIVIGVRLQAPNGAPTALPACSSTCTTDKLEESHPTMTQDRRELAKVHQKWGFGMAPPKSITQTSRLSACDSLLKVLNSEKLQFLDDDTLASMSIVKGMFNRIVKEDQWDWFTVSAQLGYPSRRISRVIANEIASLRESTKSYEAARFQVARINLLRLPTRRCLSVFIGRAKISDEPDAGWVYILSTRDIPDLLKIGMTTRPVEERVKEINGSTGVPIPFGVRRCWRVTTPAVAERKIHKVLSQFRLRGDREFFRLSFANACKQIESVIRDCNLEIRTLDALAGLAQEN